MRISDWSSDVCSSDLDVELVAVPAAAVHEDAAARGGDGQVGLGLAEAADVGGELTDLRAHQAQFLGALLGVRAFELARQRQLSRSEEHTSELQSRMRISYAVLCLRKKTRTTHIHQCAPR